MPGVINNSSDGNFTVAGVAGSKPDAQHKLASGPILGNPADTKYATGEVLLTDLQIPSNNSVTAKVSPMHRVPTFDELPDKTKLQVVEDLVQFEPLMRFIMGRADRPSIFLDSTQWSQVVAEDQLATELEVIHRNAARASVRAAA